VSVDLTVPPPEDGRRPEPNSCDASRARGGYRAGVFDALDIEWIYLAITVRLRAATGRWAQEDPEPAGLAKPADLLAAGQDLANQDRLAAVTLALVRRGQADNFIR
jgi:hypothetical protein